MHKVTLYKGKKVLSLLKSEDDRFPFTFGYAKAKLIVDNLEAVQKFVKFAESDENASNGKEEEVVLDMDSA